MSRTSARSTRPPTRSRQSKWVTQRARSSSKSVRDHSPRPDDVGDPAGVDLRRTRPERDQILDAVGGDHVGHVDAHVVVAAGYGDAPAVTGDVHPIPGAVDG